MPTMRLKHFKLEPMMSVLMFGEQVLSCIKC